MATAMRWLVGLATVSSVIVACRTRPTAGLDVGVDSGARVTAPAGIDAGHRLASYYPDPILDIGGSVGQVNVGTLQWPSGQASPTVTQASTSGATGANITICQPQASTATNGTPGNCVANLPNRTGTGNFPFFQVDQGGSPTAQIGLYSNDVNNTALWLTGVSAPTTSNYALKSNGVDTTRIQSPSNTGNLWLQYGDNTIGILFTNSGGANSVNFFGTAVDFGGGVNVIRIGNAATAPTTNPTGGGIMYSSVAGGNAELFWRDSAGNVYQITPPPTTNGFKAYFGDGSDGTGTFDGTATPAGTTKNSSTQYTLNRDVYYTSATVSTTVNVIANGWRLFCRDTLTLSGTATIQNNGANASNNNGGSPGTSHSLEGQLGGASAPTTGTTAGNAGTGFNGVSVAGYGGNGGSGGASSGSGGGAAGTNAVIPNAPRNVPELIIATVLTPESGVPAQVVCGVGAAGGSGGHQTTDGTSAAGGGGGGGGVVIVSARIIAGSGNLQAKGGVGGSASGASGAGGGGGGGFVGLVYGDQSGWTGTGQVTGGAAGTGGNASGNAGLAGLFISLQG